MAFSPETQALADDTAEELQGKLGTSKDEDKLMRSVLENDKQKVDDGKLLSDAINRNTGAFTPDLMYSSIVKNYTLAKQIYGERILRLLTGHSAEAIQRNIRIPEFHHDLLNNIRANIGRLQEEGYIDASGAIIEKGNLLATFVMYMEELEKLLPHGFSGEIVHKKRSIHGEQLDVTPYKRGNRYRDIDVKKTVAKAIKRGRAELSVEDLIAAERHSKGTAYLIFGLDASASMKGQKLEMAKKAGIALAFKAHQRRDRVGLVVFGNQVKEAVHPTDDFQSLLHSIGRIQASQETEFTGLLYKAIELFPDREVIKHLIILTDALPTKGKAPKKETLDAVSLARSHGITVSVVGISLDKEGTELAHDIARVGDGRMIAVKDLDTMDRLVLEDYEMSLNE